MDFKFSNENENSQDQAPATGKGRQNGQLLVLLVLVGVFAYVYFFTGLIKPQPVNKPAEAPAPQVVKKPMPGLVAEAGKEGAGGAAPEAKSKTATPPEVKPEPPKPAKAVVPPAATVAKEVPKAKQEVKKADVAKQADKKPLPKPAEKVDQKQQTAKAVEKKQAPAEKKLAAVKAASGKEKAIEGPKTKPQVVKAGKKVVAKSEQAVRGPWTVTTGPYLLEDSMSADLARIRKAGLEAAVQTDGRKKTTMNRLFLAEYVDRSAAQAELEKLKHFTSDAFIIDQDGKHAVYAGSYLLNDRAASEKARLAAAGFSLALKRAEVAIPAKVLTAGTYNDKKSAEAALKKLRNAGLKAHLTR